jgi:hypothetical protein
VEFAGLFDLGFSGLARWYGGRPRLPEFGDVIGGVFYVFSLVSRVLYVKWVWTVHAI